MTRARRLGVLVATPLALTACVTAPDKPVLRAVFDENPRLLGWHSGLLDHLPPPRYAHWRPAAAAMVARGMSWHGPTFSVVPAGYYRLAFRSRAPRGGMWFANFYDPGGARLIADHVSGVSASDEWQRQVYYFQTRRASPRASLLFQPGAGAELELAEVSVTPARAASVVRWLDRVAAHMPPLPYEPPAKRLAALPATRRVLGEGGTLRVVVLGDSIANDIVNSHFDLLVERGHPGTDLEVIPSVRGGKGCWYYARENRVEAFVVAHDPDLLIIAGISNVVGGAHRSEADAYRAIRSVIERSRRRTACEVMVQTGAANRIDPRGEAGFVPRAAPEGDGYRSRLHRLARDTGSAFLDLHGAWGQYVRAHDLDPMTLQRDRIHMNHRGRQLAARIMARYFTRP